MMMLSKVRVLMITGWGVGVAPLEPLKNALSQVCHVDLWEIFDPRDKEIFQQKVKAAAHYDVLLGWSLGGQLALMLANSIAEQTGIAKPLIFCMSNPCFVANEAWQTAMPTHVFQQFSSLIHEQPIKGMQRFCQLVCLGQQDAKTYASDLFKHLDLTNTQPQLQCLALLEHLDLVETLKNYTGYRLHIFSKHDVLVPSQIVQNSVFKMTDRCKFFVVDGSHYAINSEHVRIITEILAFIGSSLTDLKTQI